MFGVTAGKSHLNISKIKLAKFGSDISKVSKGITPRSCEILQTFIW